ncbi:glycoside hydrolase [Ascobolus immersus RN42]|uniref:glucan 1,3-beta-glucosidase n=1 Tax=Ascobolus immersus RN42 TaxID=1160509 RepID=A0A3N4HPZ8_ASCIM|nr:glycoside hydrolase [Ascobolus immersus RN42]
MKFLSLSLLALTVAPYISSVSAAEAGKLGFALGNQNPDGSCKKTADYKKELAIIGTRGKHIRMYTATECGDLNELLPALKGTDFKVLLGVWPTGHIQYTQDSKFEAEKEALKKALPKYGFENIMGITVGSEHMYRKELKGDKLSKNIEEVRKIVRAVKGGENIPVGTADSWNKWVEGDAEPAIVGSDIVLANAFSYWQGQKMNNATQSYYDDIMQALNRVQTVKKDQPFEFWVGETGWPSKGKAFEDGAPGSVENQRKYWKEAICSMLNWGINIFVFEAFDEDWKPAEKDNSVEKHWGVWNLDGTEKFDMSC